MGALETVKQIESFKVVFIAGKEPLLLAGLEEPWAFCNPATPAHKH